MQFLIETPGIREYLNPSGLKIALNKLKKLHLTYLDTAEIRRHLNLTLSDFGALMHLTRKQTWQYENNDMSLAMSLYYRYFLEGHVRATRWSSI